MIVLVLEKCPSLTTYSHVENRRILEMLSNIVFSINSIKFSEVNEFFFARFLMKMI